MISCRKHFSAVCVPTFMSYCENDISQSACENFTRFTNLGAVAKKDKLTG